MVLIERPPRAQEDLATGPAASFVMAPLVKDLPPRDSFDNIDQLFDEPLKVVARSTSAGRWRVAGDAAARPRSNAPSKKAAGIISAVAAEGEAAPLDSQQAEVDSAPSAVGPARPTAAGSTALRPVSIHRAPADQVVAASFPAGAMENVIFDNLSELGWRRSLLDRVGLSYRSAAIWFGGVAVGVGLTLGVAGYLLSDGSVPATEEILPLDRGDEDVAGSRTASAQPHAASDELDAPPNDISVAHLQPTSDSERTAGIEYVTDPPVTDLAVPSSDSVNQRVDDTSVPSDLPGTSSADDAFTRESDPLSPPPPPSPPADTTANASSAMPTSGDNLADFARWLQSPIAPAMGPSVPPQAAASTEASKPSSLVESSAKSDDAGDRAPSTTPAIIPTRPPAARIDVGVRLREPIAGVQLKDVALSRALRLFTDMTTVPIRLDPDVLGYRNRRASLPINVTVQSKRASEVLDKMLASVGLEYRNEDGYVEVCIESDKSKALVERKHPIADFSDADRLRLVEWVTQLIEPETWSTRDELATDATFPTAQDAGITLMGSCRVDHDDLVVLHRDVIHYRVLELCERLRIARGRQPNTRILRDRIELGSRFDRFTAFDKPVSLRITRDQSLNTILAELERQTSVSMLVDWPALQQAGWSPRDPMALFCERTPLGTALLQLLDAKGLLVHVVDNQTLEITTPAALAVRLELEVYPLADRDLALPELEDVSRQIMQQVGVVRFQPDGLGAIGYDPVGRALLVSLSQPDQQLAAKVIEQWKQTAGK